MERNNSENKKKTFTFDWLINGILTKIGEVFDGFLGRNWQPSSSLATSELVERLKLLLDAKVNKAAGNVEFAPHNIKLKMQWDKFSTDREKGIEKLENELLIAAVDHINDKRYHTYAPIKIEIKPDYFTEGIKLQAGFEKFVDEEPSDVRITIDLPELKNENAVLPENSFADDVEKQIYVAEFTEKGKVKHRTLAFAPKQRLSVGRTPENDLAIDDGSVSKVHAAFVLSSENQLMVADTGSTNGTYLNDKRIEYGKAVPFEKDDKLRFGTVEVELKYIPQEDSDEDIKEKTEVLPTVNNVDKTQNIVVLNPINENSD